jgi:CheY-like chemotaxis protein
MLLGSGRSGGLSQNGPVHRSLPPQFCRANAVASATRSAETFDGPPGVWGMSRTVVSLRQSGCQACDLHHVALTATLKRRNTRLALSSRCQAVSTTFSQPSSLLRNFREVIPPGHHEAGARELADRLAQERAGLRVLYISGYADHAVVRHGVLEEGIAFLSKPFDLRELTRTVREVLDTGRVARPLASTAESGPSGDRGLR